MHLIGWETVSLSRKNRLHGVSQSEWILWVGHAARAGRKCGLIVLTTFFEVGIFVVSFCAFFFFCCFVGLSEVSVHASNKRTSSVLELISESMSTQKKSKVVTFRVFVQCRHYSPLPSTLTPSCKSYPCCTRVRKFPRSDY